MAPFSTMNNTGGNHGTDLGWSEFRNSGSAGKAAYAVRTNAAERALWRWRPLGLVFRGGFVVPLHYSSHYNIGDDIKISRDTTSTLKCRRK